MWLCANKTLFSKPGSVGIWLTGCSQLTPGLRKAETGSSGGGQHGVHVGDTGGPQAQILVWATEVTHMK